MDLAQIRKKQRNWTIAICGLLLGIFAVIAYSAVLTKNATIDEPTQAMAGWLVLNHGDYRVNTVSPPLWECWAVLGDLGFNPPLLKDSPIWKNLTWDPEAEVIWSARSLYDSPGFDGDRFINRARGMMLLVGVALGVLLAVWSYQLAGPVAAIVATGLFCFDPNFIAHAPLIKGDVTFTLVLLSIAFTAWKLGQRATLFRMILLGILCGAAVNAKLSGVLVGPIVGLLLLVRAMSSAQWGVLDKILHTRASRLLAGLLIGLFTAACCYVVLWTCYGFRYRPAPSPEVAMNMPAIAARAKLVEATLQLGHHPSPDELARQPISRFTESIAWLDQHHWLPQALLAGLLYQHACVAIWPAFLNGELYGTGRLSYFPLAMLYKTPVAQLIAFSLSVFFFIAIFLRRRQSGRAAESTDSTAIFWTFTCLGIPFAVFAAAAITAHLNIGLRNALPVVPFLQIATGCAAAVASRSAPRLTAVMIAALAALLFFETVSAWPDYIAYFNFASGGELGGIEHLSDSNLDWGQDIKQLASWQRDHSALPLYARLYDSVDPRFYGLNFHPLTFAPTGPRAGEPQSDVPITRGWIAVSATHLQGLYIRPWERSFYERLRKLKPAFVLGGTIYIYPFNPD